MKYTIPAKVVHDNVSVEVIAYKTDTPGLITHHNIKRTYGEDYPQVGTRWVITHVKSGQGISGSFNLRKHAKEFAKRIKDIVDWTQDAEHIKAHVDTRDIQRIYREVA